MSHFYGTLKGGRAEVSRTGHKTTGIETWTASGSGAVQVEAWYDKENDCDMVRVSKRPWHGNGADTVLYEGPIGVVKEELE